MYVLFEAILAQQFPTDSLDRFCSLRTSERILSPIPSFEKWLSISPKVSFLVASRDDGAQMRQMKPKCSRYQGSIPTKSGGMANASSSSFGMRREDITK